MNIKVKSFSVSLGIKKCFAVSKVTTLFRMLSFGIDIGIQSMRIIFSIFLQQTKVLGLPVGINRSPENCLFRDTATFRYKIAIFSYLFYKFTMGTKTCEYFCNFFTKDTDSCPPFDINRYCKTSAVWLVSCTVLRHISPREVNRPIMMKWPRTGVERRSSVMLPIERSCISFYIINNNNNNPIYKAPNNFTSNFNRFRDMA